MKVTSLTHFKDLKIAVLSLLRPEHRNAISALMLDELSSYVDTLKLNEDKIRALMVWSPARKSFCAGADLKERIKMSPNEAGLFVNKLRDTFTQLSLLPFPTVACMDGPALGGGLELALSCDFRVSSINSIFGVPESSLSILPGAGGTQRLPRLIGIQKAKYLAFTSNKISAFQAFKWGLVDKVGEYIDKSENKTQENACSDIVSITDSSIYSSPQLLEIIRELSLDDRISDSGYKSESLYLGYQMIKPIIENGPIAVKLIKSAMDKGIQVDLEQGLNIEKEHYNQVLNTQDRIEALSAFANKRKPVFRGE